jgi:exonuclease III
MKGAVCQEEITIINLYAHNVNAPNVIKHTLKNFKSHIDSNTVVVGDFNALLSPIQRSNRQKNQQRNSRLNDTIEQMGLTDVYRIFHLAIVQYTFFSAAHGTFSKVDQVSLNLVDGNASRVWSESF